MPAQPQLHWFVAGWIAAIAASVISGVILDWVRGRSQRRHELWVRLLNGRQNLKQYVHQLAILDRTEVQELWNSAANGLLTALHDLFVLDPGLRDHLEQVSKLVQIVLKRGSSTEDVKRLVEEVDHLFNNGVAPTT